MTDTVKNIVVTFTFLILIFGLFLINVFKEPNDISISERRKLAQFPSITLERIGNTKFMDEFSTYVLDQFVWRDEFRSIKARFLFDALKQKDNNGIYIAEGHASKTIPNFKEGEVTATIKNINRLYKNYLSDMNVYYSIIPDKNYFLAEKNGYPHMDYEKFVKTINDNINKNIKYINIFDSLDINDYYTTDIHWRQECLGEVTRKILNELKNTNSSLTNQVGNENINNYLSEQINFEDNYTFSELYPFYGTYYGQSALPLDAETLYYLTNSNLNNVTVKILNEKALAENKILFEEQQMYNLEAFEGIDPYDVYLSGAKAIITLENPNSKTNKELILFRDSFGSSLAPLLTSEYSKITLVDLRYIASPLVNNIVEFKEGQDVLILYSTEVLNNGSILKIL